MTWLISIFATLFSQAISPLDFIDDPVSRQLVTKEPWYLTFTIGLGADPEYSQGIGRSIAKLEDGDNTAKSNFKLNLGAYFPTFSDKLIYGGHLIYFADTLRQIEGQSISVDNTLVNLSALYGFGEHVERGFFLRLEAGVAQTSIGSRKTSIVKQSEGIYWGWSFVTGLGLLMPVNQRSRFTINFDYHSVNLTFTRINYSAVSVGMMF